MLCRLVSTIWKSLGFVDEYGLCGTVWAVWNRVGYVE